NNNIALFFRNNAVARLKHVDLQDVDQMIFKYKSERPGGRMSLHMDAPDGPVLASWPLSIGTNYQTAYIDFKKQSGVHDVFVRYSNPSLNKKEDLVVFFDWFYFSGQLPGKGKPGYEVYKKTFNDLL